jgi:hypothetical protein
MEIVGTLCDKRFTRRRRRRYLFSVMSQTSSVVIDVAVRKPSRLPPPSQSQPGRLQYRRLFSSSALFFTHAASITERSRIGWESRRGEGRRAAEGRSQRYSARITGKMDEGRGGLVYDAKHILRDGSFEGRFPRHFVPAYDHAVPPGQNSCEFSVVSGRSANHSWKAPSLDTPETNVG